MKQNINHSVMKILGSEVSIQKDLNRGIINTRALAKFIIDKYQLQASLDSVISAIRRYNVSETKTKEDNVVSMFKGAQISTKNNINCLVFRKEAQKYVNSFDLLTTDKAKIVCGTNEIRVIAHHREVKEVLKIFKKENLISTEEELSEISVIITPKVKETKGVLARMANEIAMHGVNIVEVIICPPEFLIYVNEKDAIATHETLYQLHR